MASPRFVIAFIIALTVSKPIELRLFQNRIDKELEKIVKTEDGKFDEEEQNRIKALNAQLGSINKQEQDDKLAVFSNNPIYQNAKVKIPALESQIITKNQQIEANKKVIEANQYKVIKERKKLNPVTNEPVVERYIVWLPNAKAVAKIVENRNLESERQKLQAELSEEKQKQNGVESSLSEQANAISEKYKSAKENISHQIENLNTTYTVRKTNWVNANKKSTDLPARLEALGNISSFGNPIWWASLIITLLFIVLETAPVIVKLLTKRGPYDEILDATEYKTYIEQSRIVDNLNRTINAYLQKANKAAEMSGELLLKADSDKLEVQLSNNKRLLDKLADYQQELAHIYADAWYQEEKDKALQQAKGIYQQANQNKQQPKIEDTFWKQKGVSDRIEYYFRNNSTENKELLYFKNEQLSLGKWCFNSSKDEVAIFLQNNNYEYVITEINDTTLILKDKATNDILEFEK